MKVLSRLSYLAKFILLGCGLTMTCAGCTSETPANNSVISPTKSEIPTAPETSTAETEYKLIWSDEFEGENGSSVDSDKWVIETGNNRGWGNNELQYYTGNTGNVSIQDGNLVIKAVKEDKEGFKYTSARIKTQGKFQFKYGKIEMRARLPYGKGIWPAFWMLGHDIGSIGWPKCGEVDIMEFIGRLPDQIHGTLHGPEYNGSMGLTKSVTVKDDLHDTCHTYSVEWDEDGIRWYFDGEEYHKILKDNLPSTYSWPYDKDFFILVNLAVGGNWPQNPDDTTVFPQTYTIDYIRVYQK